MLTDLGSLEELGDGRLHVRRVGRRELGVLVRGDRAVAIRNVCPHAGAPLCRGVVSPLVTGSLDGPVASVRAEGERLMVSCPWHGWEFDVDTGQALADPTMRVKTYPLIVRDGRVLLEVVG